MGVGGGRATGELARKSITPSPGTPGEGWGGGFGGAIFKTLMPRKRNHSRRLLSFARNMRKEPTDAEKKLWFLLRDHKIDGFHFRRQVPIAGYIVDFCCFSAGLGAWKQTEDSIMRKTASVTISKELRRCFSMASESFASLITIF